MNWKLHTLPIAFQHVTGSHTGKAIKKQFEEIARKYNIRHKVFKIVADQAANVKKAFVDTTESDDVITIATSLIRRQKNIDAIAEKERLRIYQEQINKDVLDGEIEAMNKTSPVAELSRKRTAAELIEEFEQDFEDSEEPEESLLGN